MDDSQADFQTALAEEFGFAPEADEPTTTPDTTSEVAEVPDADKPKAVTEEQVPEAKGEEKPVADEPAIPQGEATPKFATKQDVLDAMKEYNSETTGRIDKVATVSKEIIDSLHPEGIDRTLYDTNGAVIKTAQDIVDRGLVNERTGDTFTYEEAASFILEANRQMDQNIGELEKWAGDVAEKNINLLEGNERVMSQWKDVLEAMPNVAKDLAERYISTQLEFDKTNSYITRMSMTPEDFYNMTLTPYRQLGEALAAKEATAVAEQAQTQASEQDERNGIPGQRGQSNMPSNTGDAMVDALIDEINKA